jgi:hypothetical protein
MRLKIKNPHKIIGKEYDSRLDVVGVKEYENVYEFTLGAKNTMSRQNETILLHRKQTQNGMWIMEYKNKTLWLNKNEFDTMDKIIICMQTI